ncbi:MAG: MoxR family ATPase [Lachnospira sp.]|nr:MoxR family ATPase [Lachnospira sp.]
MQIKELQVLCDAIKSNISKVMIGNETVINLILTASLARGHILLEDKPGTGKTTMAKAFAKSVDASFKRVQLTPDLMPADIVGLNVFNQKMTEFQLMKGPVFTDILLADEINRTTPRTQSALLEAMEERQVTIDGETLPLPSSFLVIATQNPVETVGTYPLPEAQLDRFMMKLAMEDMGIKEQLEVMERFLVEEPLKKLSPVCTRKQLEQMSETVKTVTVRDCVREYIAKIVLAISQHENVELGVSPRGMLALLRCSQAFVAIRGKDYVEPDDVRFLAPYVLAHRIRVYGGIRQNNQSRRLVEEIIKTVPVPVEDWGTA